jgi:UDP:flavonoid glycosyltransferase YjiC (YdhE family)
VPPFGLGLRPRGGLAGRVRDRLLGAVVARFDAQAGLPAVNAGRGAAGLPPLARAADTRHRGALTLYCTAEPFDYRRPPIDGVLPVGPLVWDPPAELDAEVAAALDGDERPLVLVSCSSEFQGDGAIAAAALEGLTDRFQVVVTSAGVDPATLPARGGAVVRRFLPHAPLLARAAVVVCHGGMGVTQKALAAGVPVVVVPWGRDQLDVAVHVLEADAGARVPRRRLTARRLAEAVELARAKAAGAAAVAAGYAATGGATAAADALAALAGQDGGAAPAAATALS